MVIDRDDVECYCLEPGAGAGSKSQRAATGRRREQINRRSPLAAELVPRKIRPRYTPPGTRPARSDVGLRRAVSHSTPVTSDLLEY